MTYTPNPDSREERMLASLLVGVPFTLARLAAGYTAKTLAAAYAATPGLREAVGEAEAEGRREASRVESGRMGEEASDGVQGEPGDVREVDRGGSRMAGEPAADAGARPRDPDRQGESAARVRDDGPESGAVPARLTDERPATGGRAASLSRVAAHTLAPSTTPPAPVKPDPSGLRALGEAEEMRRGLERLRLAEGANDAVTAAAPTYSKRGAEHTEDEAADERWARIYDKVNANGGGKMGALLWLERQVVDGAERMHALSDPWRAHFGDFYESGKFLDVGRFGVRAAKSDSTLYALVAEVLLTPRLLQPNIVGVCPIMSANMREAGDRFDTARTLLRGCGFLDISGSKASVEPFKFKASGGGSTALVIETIDAGGHRVEFRIYPASVPGAAGFTGIAGFGDELDLWGKTDGANPAQRVVEVLISRYTTQPEAVLHLMSATYDRDSAHAALIKLGDTPMQRVARLGAWGAAKDYEDRMRLAASIKSEDPLLTAPPLIPDCTDVPCWVTNPVAPIESCYQKSGGDVRRMFSLYGGRPDLGDGGSAGAAAQCLLAARITSDLAAGRSAGSWRGDGPQKIAGAPVGDPRYTGPTSGRSGKAHVDWRKRRGF